MLISAKRLKRRFKFKAMQKRPSGAFLLFSGAGSIPSLDNQLTSKTAFFNNLFGGFGKMVADYLGLINTVLWLLGRFSGLKYLLPALKETVKVVFYYVRFIKFSSIQKQTSWSGFGVSFSQRNYIFCFSSPWCV